MTPATYGQFLNTPLALDTRGIRSLIATAQAYQARGMEEREPKGEITHDCYLNPIPAPVLYTDGTLMLPLKGVVSRGLGPIGKYFGFLDIDEFAGWVSDAMVNPDVKRIALDVDSPGGTVIGTRTAAELVAMADKIKPVMVYTNGMMASAAYYIASSARAIYASSSAIVGSIGVYTYLAGDTVMNGEKCGVNYIVVRSGKLKGAGIDDVTEEQRAMIQEEIDALGEEFRSFVELRRTVSRENMEGQTFSGDRAADAGFVGGLAHNFHEAVSRFKTLNP